MKEIGMVIDEITLFRLQSNNNKNESIEITVLDRCPRLLQRH